MVTRPRPWTFSGQKPQRSRSRYTLLIPTYNRPDHLRRLLGYTPDALSYVRISPTSYGAAGSRSSAQLEVLRSWLELTRRPGWERRRAAFVAAACTNR